MKNQ